MHINDLASAHLQAFQLMRMTELITFNLDKDWGFRVLEVIETARCVTDRVIVSSRLCVGRVPRGPGGVQREGASRAGVATTVH